ncbi:hypothetical protein OEA41_004309 [Lepraria neglecta]|uniref:Dynamin-binding protein n=1 Tax=Lepraria neglecta TaxID=209136 RepID=A0AAE0DI58_9LECA|nr:hypothetical protein OEA41_004309 [Lepraria neglecta]
MSSLDVDHNHYPLDRGDHSQESSVQSAYDPTARSIDSSLVPNDSSIPPLPAHTYTQPSGKRSKIAAHFEQSANNARANGIARDNSPDPHDFYRRPFQEEDYRTTSAKRPDGSNKVDHRDGGMVGSVHQPRVTPISTRISSRYNSTSTDRSPLSGAKSSPTLSKTARNRQTSLKDLVDKFNQNPDEALPLPRRSTSRSPSASPGGHNVVRARTSSLSNRQGNGSARKASTAGPAQATGTSRTYPRGEGTNGGINTSPRSRRLQRSQRADHIDSMPYASQSTTNLSDTHSQRPLFGELLAMSPSHPDLGYGIPSNARRRRGSEGSMHSPNPMFPQERGQPEVSPSSPAAWYLGVTPTLEEIKTERAIPDLPPNMHRRTRSDFTGAPSRLPTSRFYGTNLSPPRDLPSTPSSASSSKRNSHSRIPISTRRMSATSDSGNSTQSTRANSALGRAKIKSPTRIAAPTSKHGKNPRSPPQHSRSNTPQKSPHRSDFGLATQRTSPSPHLKAYISIPMPKKSPPLRSSKPRQPVSNASTSASRARVVERFSSHENGNAKNTRERKLYKPPELAGVDFAARREKIQQAVTQTVRENERLDEQRRASMALGNQSLEASTTSNGDDEPRCQEEISKEPPDLNQEDAQDVEKDDFPNPTEEIPRSERELTIDTGHLPERSVLDLSMEDSPTLGIFNRFTTNPSRFQHSSVTTPSDVEPSSAITASTSDSVDTFFDDEPQDDSLDSSRHHSHEHQTLLNHIMTMRDSSPSPEGARMPATTEGSTSEHDDQESIQIMLGESPVLEKAPSKEQFEAKLTDSQSGEGQESRWSMGSWTSSTRSRDERDTPMERIDEHSPPPQEQPGHLSVSTSGSQQTPQPWSPASFTSAQTARTTMDSDAYSTINRVLDHYHDPSLVSAQLMQDVQQHIFNQSPDLARQGGWDPKKVTQLYLQELAKGRYRQSSTTSDSSSFQARPRKNSIKVPKVPEKEVREDHDEKMVEQIEFDYEELTPPATSLGVDEGDIRPARASLNRLEDWDMSPSMGGLELQAESLDSPAGDEKPALPPKDWRSIKRELADDSDPKEGQARQTAADSGPRLPPIDGLGIEINIMGPQRTDSPVIPPPPLPIHSPPPPPSVEPSPPRGARSPPSPSVYSKHVASSIYPTSTPTDAPVPPLPSNEPRQPRSVTSSIQPSGSSTISQGRPSVDGPSTEGTSKNSSPSPDQKRLKRRRHIIEEIVLTEHSFGQDMKVVDDIYKGTSNVIIISAKDVKTLFSNSNEIVAFSTIFLDALKQASKSVYVLPKSKRWRSNRVSNATSYSGNTDDQSSINGVELNDEEKDRKTSMGEAFGEHMAKMEQVYTEYLRNQKTATERLEFLQQDPKVQIWLKECRAYAHDLTTAWDLHSLLIKPFQRLTKYPLLLKELVEVTPDNHPDFTALDIAHREVKGIVKRIDEMNGRAIIMQQIAQPGRKRKESESRPRIFARQFGLRAEKSKLLGSSGTIEDKAYSTVSERFGSHFFQLQVVMRDVEMYTTDVQTYMNKFCELALAMEAHIEVGPPSSYPEVESKWHKFRMSTREMSMTALTDHIAAVRKNVIEPMNTLLRMHEGPQKLMHKRNKRVADYNRLKDFRDRGDKPDKKTVEQGEQFQVLNELLKDELPKLFAMTAKLVEACLNGFVQLQLQWQVIWRRKLSQALDDRKAPGSVQEIQDAFAGDFKFVEASVLSLGICNGSMLNDVANQISFFSSERTTLNGDDSGMVSHGSSLESKRRTLSVSSEQSPVLPQPDFGGRGSGSFFNVGDSTQLATGGNYVEPNRRLRASSTLSGHSPRTPEVPGSYPSYSNSTTPVNSIPGRPSTANPRTFTEPLPSPSRPSTETPSLNRASEESVRAGRIPGSTYPQINSQARAGSPSQRYSGFFSSAMPMSDSPRTESPAPGQAQMDFNVIFLAASVYEFNIDRQRREAGYPYLTYVAGEIFDVIGEKGELWLAKNQDDSNNEVGWIWNKHFVKLAS